MTVTTTANSITYAANGVTTAFAFPYIFFAPVDLVVSLLTSTGTSVAPAPVLGGVATYDYTVTGVVSDGEYASGGTVTFNTAPASGLTVALMRAVAATQDVTLIDNTKFPAATVNTEFDKLTVLLQDQMNALDGAIQVPDGPIQGLPPASQRAGMILGFDGSGQPILIPPSSLSPIVPSRTITDTTYTLQAADNGFTLRFLSADPVSVTFPGSLVVDFQCILFQAAAGTVTCIEQGSQIENGYDATGSEQRSIDGRGFGLHVWCDENLTGSAAHFWIQGVTKS